MVNYCMTKEAVIHMGKRQLLNECCWENWTDTGKKMKLGHLYGAHEYTKN